MKELTSVIIKNSGKDNKSKSKKELLLSSLSFLIVFTTIAFMMVIGSVIITNRLVETGKPHIFINILLLANYFILIFSSAFSSLNSLYFSKDLKILLRMPIKSKDIIKAKIIQMTISEYQMEMILLAIPMIVYGILTKVNMIFYVYMIIILLLLPIIPILIATLINAIVMRIINFMKNKSKIMYITIILCTNIISILLICFNKVNIYSTDQFLLIKPIMNALLNFNNINGIKNISIFLFENFAFYIVIIFITSKIYFRGVIGTTVNSNKIINNKKQKIKISDFKEKSIINSYIKKEFTIIVRTPMFFLPCIIVPIIFSLLIIVILFGALININISIPNAKEVLANIINMPLGIALLIIITQFIYMINFNSIIAVSKERANARIIKYIPIDLAKQFKFKIVLGFLINMIIAIAVSMFCYMCTKKIILTLELFVILVLINIIGEKFKLLIDINNPQMKWTSEFMMLKQNTNVMYELFYTLSISIIIFFLSILINKQQIFLSCLLIILVCVYILISRYICNKKNRIFAKIY